MARAAISSVPLLDLRFDRSSLSILEGLFGHRKDLQPRVLGIPFPVACSSDSLALVSHSIRFWYMIAPGLSPFMIVVLSTESRHLYIDREPLLQWTRYDSCTRQSEAELGNVT